MSERVITFPCDDGVIEARQRARGGPWLIGYPWGDDRFYGSATEVKARIKRALKANEDGLTHAVRTST